MKKYLGIDLGSKSLGLSISNSGIIASTYSTFYFKNDNYQEALEIVNMIVLKESIDIIVLGLPKHMNNDVGIRGEISIKFKEMITSVNNIEVILWDERNSTKTAINTMINANVSRKKQKTKKDEMAAVVILQSYLDYKEKQNGR